MNGLEFNKIAAAVLLSGIIAMVSGLVAEGLYSGGHDEEAAKRGYTIEGAESAEAPAGTPAATEKPVDIAPLLAKEDVTKRQDIIKQCTACHTYEKGGRNGVGPNQYGLLGAAFAHMEGYAYSDALKAQHGKKTWTFQELSEFLANPKKHSPGTKMAYAGMKKPEDRANLIAYLNTLSDKPLPLAK